MRHRLIVTECASFAIGKGAPSGLCGITVTAMAIVSIHGDGRKVLAYHYHLCWRRDHASPGVEQGHVTCAVAQGGACPLTLCLLPPFPARSRWIVAYLSPERRALRLWGHAG